MTDREAIDKIISVTGIKYDDEQMKVLECRDGMCVVSSAGSGKALLNGTGVLTPNGYVPIETLKVGDICYDDNGEEQQVIGVYPQGEKEIYDVTFSDGTVIKCCKDHLWTYQTYSMRNSSKKWRTHSLEYINENVPITTSPHNYKKDSNTYGRKNIYIPMSKAVKFSKKELPIPPYLLGALLGDGCLKSRDVNCNYGFTNDNTQIIDRVREELKVVNANLVDTNNPIDFAINVGTGYGDNGRCGKFTHILKELGLKDTGSSDKFIPEIYKYSSIEDRLQVIQGIIDTDGHCKGSSYELTLKSERLIDDVKFILETLGMTAVKKEKSIGYNGKDGRVDCGKAYRLYIKTSVDIPKIHWSKARDEQWKSGQSSARRTIESIVPTGQYGEMTCIKVSGPNELFLTENCVVTHNTATLVASIAKRFLTGEIKSAKKLLVTTYSVAGREELEDRLNKLLKAVGVSETVEIRTLHSAYLNMMQKYGGGVGQILKAYERTDLIKRSIKKAGLMNMEEEDIAKIDSLISYQVNNMLTDELLFKETIFDLDIEPCKYSEIAANYRQFKSENGLIDFDDMQTKVFFLMATDKDAREMFRNMWDYFYIDEFQDVSKIQFNILKMMLKDEKKLVVIGDDDQCLIEGTQVLTPDGYKNIEDIKVGDFVASGIGHSEHKYMKVNHISVKPVEENIVHIKTASGLSLKGTGNHVGFARKANSSDVCLNNKIVNTLFANDKTELTGVYVSETSVSEDSTEMVKVVNKLIEDICLTGESRVSSAYSEICNIANKGVNVPVDSLLQRTFSYDLYLKCKASGVDISIDDVIERAKFTDESFDFTLLENFEVGMIVPIYKDGKIIEDVVTDVTREYYSGNVYDLSVPHSYNFVANDIVVHNCIYKWRGADPSIILNICGYYDITRHIISTNYRCGRTIVEHAATCIGNNSMRMEKQMKAFNDGGNIEIVKCSNNMFDMSKKVSERIMQWIAEGIEPKNIAVLCRNNIHGVIIDDMLSQNVLTKTSKEMKFGTNQFIRDFLMCLEISSNTNNHIIVKHMWKIVQYLKSTHANTISHIMDVHSCSLKVALKSLLINVFQIHLKEGSEVKNLREIGKQYDKLAYSMNSKAVDELVSLYRILCEEDEVLRFENIVAKYLGVTINFLHKGEDRVRNIMGIANYMVELANTKGIDGMEDHVRESIATAKADIAKDANAVTLSTMHGSKGKEWKKVILMADDNIAFPNLTGIRQMLEEGSPLPEVADYIEQERRLHYVAMTRAKEELLVYTDVNYMSVFMAEALGIIAKQDKHNTHIIDLAVQGGYDRDLLRHIEEVTANYIVNDEDEEVVQETSEIADELNRDIAIAEAEENLSKLNTVLSNYLTMYSEDDDDYDENVVSQLKQKIDNHKKTIESYRAS